jgi:hypothetical protein
MGVMPALAVLREFVDSPTDAEGWLVTTYDQLAGRTFFKRSTVARASADLEVIGVIERAKGPGFRGHYRIARAATPAPAAPAVEASMAPVTPSLTPIPGGATSGARGERDPASADDVRSGGHPTASMAPLTAPHAAPAPQFAILEIRGVQFPIPAGVTLTPELDAEGRVWYRLGTGRIGPIDIG